MSGTHDKTRELFGILPLSQQVKVIKQARRECDLQPLDSLAYKGTTCRHPCRMTACPMWKERISYYTYWQMRGHYKGEIQ